MADRILQTVKDIPEPKIAVWGTAFKGGTDDCRESPAMQIIQILLERGAKITVYDPQAMDNARKILGDSVAYAPDMYTAADEADVLAVLTEWEDFKTSDLQKLKSRLKTPKIIDLRHLINRETAQANGFEIFSLGIK